MESGTLALIVLAIIAVAVIFIWVGTSKKSKPTSTTSTSKGKLNGSLVNPPYVGTRPVGTTPVGTTPVGTSPVGAPPVRGGIPRPDPTPAPGNNSVFFYVSNSAVWRCPNCECENSPENTHCMVCFWDKTQEVR